jgi:hypothetical protein
MGSPHPFNVKGLRIYKVSTPYAKDRFFSRDMICIVFLGLEKKGEASCI